MGEAKRRKKLDPNFGQIQLEVQLKPNIELPVELEKLKQILLKEGKKWEVGEVSIKGKTYPAVFMPFTKYYQGRLKLYSQVAFAPDCQLKMSQNPLFSQRVRSRELKFLSNMEFSPSEAKARNRQCVVRVQQDIRIN